MTVTVATPLVMADPGALFWAPLASALPTNTVAGSVFTDAWPVAWKALGATEEGSEFGYESKVEAISVAEFFDPISYRTVERSGSITFSMADWTLENFKRALNGGTLATVSGTGATLLSKYDPPSPGQEVRCMIGWESLDATVRIVMYQTIQGGSLKTKFAKSPDKALLPVTFQMEKPTSTQPFSIWAAGTGRLGV